MGAIRFLLDGQVHEVRDLPPTTTVLQYLREHAGRTGTKEGCAEGDCGACTVVLGELAGERLRYRAINSCIRFLPTIDGRELVTVESLRAPDGALHPVQQALVDHHASQCGFCTPGFVMSLFALYLQPGAPARAEVLDALAGNLCRCTGYRPIVDAGCAMRGYPEPSHWGREHAHSPQRAEALRALQREEALDLPGFVAPMTLDALAETLQRRPDALVLAGATDVGLWVTKQLRELPRLVYVGEVAALQRIERTDRALTIGAAVPLTDAWAALVALCPAFQELADRFASPPVRNSGTLGGNVANGSPIGDSMPALIALGAEVVLRSGRDERSLPLERFYPGYRKTDLAPGEFVAYLRVPVPQPGRRIAAYKLSKRIDQDISAVCAAFSLAIEDGMVRDARLAFGGMAATPGRASATEAALIGRPWTLASLEQAAARLAEDFSPLTDLRATGAYRLQAAGNLLRRFFLAQQPASLPLRTFDLA